MFLKEIPSLSDQTVAANISIQEMLQKFDEFVEKQGLAVNFNWDYERKPVGRLTD